MLPSLLMPLWVCLACTAWTAALIPIYWRHLGPTNFLWFSDIALFLTVAALWSNSRWLISLAAVSVLLLELTWNVDFFLQLAGVRLTGMTDYMFDTTAPLVVRGMSLFHVWMPAIMLWMTRRTGYERRAVWVQTGVGWIVLTVTFLLTDPDKNINWVWNLGGLRLDIPPVAYLAGMMLAMPLVAYLPTHLLLRWWAPRPRR